MADFYCKYKSLRSMNDLIRVLDILKNNKIYFPSIDELNDPYEGLFSNIKCAGLMGSSIFESMDKIHPILKDKINEYRVLSLSEDYLSQLMWSHYSNNYNGICFCYKTNRSFIDAKPVVYSSEFNGSFIIQDIVDEQIYIKLLTQKNKCWDYEKEWRIISKTNEKYFSYKSDDLEVVIVGYKVDDRIVKLIKESVPKNVLIMKCYCGEVSNRNYLLPEDYRIVADGSKIKKIYDLKEYLENM